MKCKKCSEPHVAATAGLIAGLCSRCSRLTESGARRRGFDLHQIPHPRAHTQELTVDGVKLFYWRNQWRAE